MKIIAVEEHFTTEASLTHFRPPIKFAQQDITDEGLDRIGEALDHTEERLKDMDEAGIDMQVLSLGPGVEQYDASEGTSIAKSVNDELSKVVKKYPERFAGFATIAPQDPDAAANELERAAKKLGLKGTMIKSHTRGEYLDDQKYWVLFERAEKLDVPVYLHPREPSPNMLKPYLIYPALAGAMWGFGAEAGLHAMRLICSGVFDKYPGLKIILGHLGEAIPFWLWRIDKHAPVSKLQKKPSQYFKDNFYVTTSGMFWQPALQFVYSALGADRILFAVDYPMESSKDAIQSIESMPIIDDDKEKIFHLNAEKLLRL